MKRSEDMLGAGGGGRAAAKRLLYVTIFAVTPRPRDVFHKHQGYGRGVPLIFTPGSKPKNGIPFLDQGYGRGVPPSFTPGSKPKKKGIVLRYTSFWLFHTLFRL